MRNQEISKSGRNHLKPMKSCYNSRNPLEITVNHEIICQISVHVNLCILRKLPSNTSALINDDVRLIEIRSLKPWNLEKVMDRKNGKYSL